MVGFATKGVEVLDMAVLAKKDIDELESKSSNKSKSASSSINSVSKISGSS